MAAGLTLTTNPTTLTNPIVFNGTAVYGPAGTAWTVTNQSVIAGSGGSGVGIQLQAGGSVTNQAGASIVGGNRGVNIYGAPGSVTNSGFIDGIGSAAIVFNSGAGVISNLGTITNGNGLAAFTIAMTGGGSITNGASGSTAALISGGGIIMDGVGTVTNFGTISDLTPEAILFGTAGANRLIDEPGSQITASGNPVVFSVGGSSVIELAGTTQGVITGIGTSYQGFQTVQFDAGAQWTAVVPSGATLPKFTGFAQGDTLNLAGVTANNATYSGGVLTLKEGGTTIKTLNLTTPVTNPVFDVTTVAGGTNITVLPTDSPATFDTTFNVVGVGDVDGDGNPDIIVQQRTSGIVEAQNLVGTTPIGGGAISPSPFGAPFQVAAVNDFNGDGDADLVYRNTQTGLTEIQYLTGTTPAGGGALNNNPFDLSFNIVGSGDFNGDGHNDLVWQQGSTGLVELQFLTGTTEIGGGTITNSPFNTPDWQVVATGDFNSDGTADLVYHNTQTGLTEIQFLNGTSAVGGGALSNNPFDTSFNIVGAGDFNGDGHLDLVWQQASTGLVEVQFLNGTTEFGGGALTNNPLATPAWQVVGVGNFNHNTQAGLVYHNSSTGAVDIQLLNGTTILSTTTISMS